MLTMETYPVLERKGILTRATTWMNLENTLSERSQIQNLIPFILKFRTGKCLEAVNSFLGAGGGRTDRGSEVVAKGDRVLFFLNLGL